MKSSRCNWCQWRRHKSIYIHPAFAFSFTCCPTLAWHQSVPQTSDPADLFFFLIISFWGKSSGSRSRQLLGRWSKWIVQLTTGLKSLVSILDIFDSHMVRKHVNWLIRKLKVCRKIAYSSAVSKNTEKKCDFPCSNFSLFFFVFCFLTTWCSEASLKDARGSAGAMFLHRDGGERYLALIR